jgi:hypothetical protein
MSHSRKKHPVISIACCGKGSAMRAAKRQANRRLRRELNQNLDTEYAKRFKQFEERWSWPDDGKQWWDNPKSYRK